MSRNTSRRQCGKWSDARGCDVGHRDDLAEAERKQFAKTIHAIKNNCAKTVIEVLNSRLSGSIDALRIVTDAIRHFINTIWKPCRGSTRSAPEGGLRTVPDTRSKTSNYWTEASTQVGIMLDWETKEECLICCDSCGSGVRVFDHRQYLPPSKTASSVIEFVHPDQFEEYRFAAEQWAFLCASSTLVRALIRGQSIRSFGTQSEDEKRGKRWNFI
jgi:lipoic acid synthetase